LTNGPCLKFDEKNFDEFTVVGTERKGKFLMNFWPFVKFPPIKLLHYTVIVECSIRVTQSAVSANEISGV